MRIILHSSALMPAIAGSRPFFRSAAVNMPALFVKERQTQEDLAVRKELEEKGYFDTNAGLGRPVRITKEMFHDLEETDLFRLFHPRDTQVMMAHGEEDTVIDPAADGKTAQHKSVIRYGGQGDLFARDSKQILIGGFAVLNLPDHAAGSAADSGMILAYRIEFAEQGRQNNL